MRTAFISLRPSTNAGDAPSSTKPSSPRVKEFGERPARQPTRGYGDLPSETKTRTSSRRKFAFGNRPRPTAPPMNLGLSRLVETPALMLVTFQHGGLANIRLSDVSIRPFRKPQSSPLLLSLSLKAHANALPSGTAVTLSRERLQKPGGPRSFHDAGCSFTETFSCGLRIPGTAA